MASVATDDLRHLSTEKVKSDPSFKSISFLRPMWHGLCTLTYSTLSSRPCGRTSSWVHHELQFIFLLKVLLSNILNSKHSPLKLGWHVGIGWSLRTKTASSPSMHKLKRNFRVRNPTLSPGAFSASMASVATDDLRHLSTEKVKSDPSFKSISFLRPMWHGLCTLTYSTLSSRPCGRTSSWVHHELQFIFLLKVLLSNILNSKHSPRLLPSVLGTRLRRMKESV